MSTSLLSPFSGVFKNLRMVQIRLFVLNFHLWLKNSESLKNLFTIDLSVSQWDRLSFGNSLFSPCSFVILHGTEFLNIKKYMFFLSNPPFPLLQPHYIHIVWVFIVVFCVWYMRVHRGLGESYFICFGVFLIWSKHPSHFLEFAKSDFLCGCKQTSSPSKDYCLLKSGLIFPNK